MKKMKNVVLALCVAMLFAVCATEKVTVGAMGKLRCRDSERAEGCCPPGQRIGVPW